MFYCGIDIAKYKHEATIIDESGTALLNSLSFANSKEGCEKLTALFEKLYISKDNLLIGMEATGHYWLSVYGYLLECGFEVKVINPIQSEAFRKMYIRQTKTDRKDSFVIAQIMRFGQFSATNLSEETIIALRQLSRYRLALVDNCGDCKRRVVALLDQIFPEYNSLFSDTFGVTSKEVLSQYPTPEELLSVSTRKLSNLLGKVSHGRFGKEKAKQLKAAASDSFGVSFARNAFAFQIRQLIEQLEFLEGQIVELEEQISSLLKQTGSYITTIPGIGDTLGAIILSEIGDIRRFDAPNKLVALVNLPEHVRKSPSAALHIFAGPSGWLLPEQLFVTLFSQNIISPSAPVANTILPPLALSPESSATSSILFLKRTDLGSRYLPETKKCRIIPNNSNRKRFPCFRSYYLLKSFDLGGFSYDRNTECLTLFWHYPLLQRI